MNAEFFFVYWEGNAVKFFRVMAEHKADALHKISAKEGYPEECFSQIDIITIY